MRRTILLAATLAALALPSFARADDTAVAEANLRFEEGLSLADAGKHEEARLKFQQAAAVLHAPAVLFNLARAEHLTGHDYEALEHYKQFLRASQHDAKITDAKREEARRHVAALASKVGQIDVDAPTGARITIDGKQLEEPATEPIAVTAGSHVVEATFEGRAKSVNVDCPAGVITKAKIVIDSGPVMVTEPPPLAPRTPDRIRWYVGGALGAAGVVGLGVGVGFALSSQSAKNDSEVIRRANPGLCGPPQPTDPCAKYDERRRAAESAGAVSTVGYVAGGLLVAGAVATVLLWPKPKETTLARALAPWASKDGAGAAFTGNF